jgi:UDP-N-acetylglucosamine--N-acetylmuramyl-(pentapeptide) pyrophosphoryl-undecaprenol N-acetylglucosamine transferase
MRLLITGGGTAGHVYPALSVLATPAAQQTEVLWVGTQGGLEQGLIERAGLRFAGIPAGGVRGLNPLIQARSLLRLSRGFVQAWRLLRDFRPDVVFVTGGYVTVPVGLAAWLQRRPILIYLPDLEPGLAIRALAPIATRIAITAEPVTCFFAAGKAIVTGYPVRPELTPPRPRATARATFSIPADANVVLVFGGSQGAQALNEAIGANLPALLADVAHHPVYLIHIHGKSNRDWLHQQRAALPPELQPHYQLFEYLHSEMADALAAADLVVSRAGAAILGEYPAMGLPAILVPLPIAGGHQSINAALLSQQGAAVTLPNKQAAADLVPLVRDLLNDPPRLQRMRAAMSALARPNAAERIFTILQELAHGVRQAAPKQWNKGGLS